MLVIGGGGPAAGLVRGTVLQNILRWIVGRVAGAAQHSVRQPLVSSPQGAFSSSVTLQSSAVAVVVRWRRLRWPARHYPSSSGWVGTPDCGLSLD